MEWLIAIPIGLMLLICPLMMLGMIVGGWIFARRAGAGGHAGHGMMKCHGEHGSDETPATNGVGVEELRAERERLDRLIERTEKDGMR